MNKTIRLTLVKPLIIEAVKGETFLRGQVEKAADEKAIAVAYHEQAGDETYQERLLERGLYSNLEELKTHLSDYLSTVGGSSADNNIDSGTEGDNIIISLVVGDRFNNGYTTTLARLCSKYIEESMLMDWWRPVNEKQSSLYSQFMERDLAAIKRCFNKTAPTAPTVPYPTEIRVSGDVIDIGVEEEATVNYSISDGATDDVEVRGYDQRIIGAGRTEEGFTVIGRHLGHTTIELYSRHDTNVKRRVEVYVTEQY